MFCDSDIVLPKDCIDDMLDISKKNNNCIVCGIYPVVWIMDYPLYLLLMV